MPKNEARPTERAFWTEQGMRLGLSLGEVEERVPFGRLMSLVHARWVADGVPTRWAGMRGAVAREDVERALGRPWGQAVEVGTLVGEGAAAGANVVGEDGKWGVDRGGEFG